MNNLSEAVAYYKVYDGESNEYYGIASIELPELTKATVDLKGSGIIGTISAPIEFSLDSMSATLNFRTLSASAVNFIAPGKKSFVLVFLNQETDISTLAPVFKGYRILLEGKSKSVKLGSVNTGEATDTSCELEVYRMKVTESGTDRMEINKLGGIFSINGINYIEYINSGLASGTDVDLAGAIASLGGITAALTTGNGTSISAAISGL